MLELSVLVSSLVEELLKGTELEEQPGVMVGDVFLSNLRMVRIRALRIGQRYLVQDLEVESIGCRLVVGMASRDCVLYLALS